jgi:hypothetical protein
MAKSINTLVASCFAAAESFAAKVDALRDAMPADALADKAACMAYLQKPTADYYNVKLVKNENTGRITWPKDTEAGVAAAKKQQQRLCKAVMAGEESQHADAEEECEVPAELLAAAAKLAKLAKEYEGARKLASRAIAAAFAK